MYLQIPGRELRREPDEHIGAFAVHSDSYMDVVFAERQRIRYGFSVSDISELLAVDINAESSRGAKEITHSVNPQLTLLRRELSSALAHYRAVDVSYRPAVWAFYSESASHKIAPFGYILL